MKESPTIADFTQARLDHMAQVMMEDARPEQEVVREVLIENLEERLVAKIHILIFLMSILGVVGAAIFASYGLAKLRTVLKEEFQRSFRSVIKKNVSTHKLNTNLKATIEQRVLQILGRAEENNYSTAETALAICSSLQVFGKDIVYVNGLETMLPKPHYIRVWLETPTEDDPRFEKD